MASVSAAPRQRPRQAHAAALQTHAHAPRAALCRHRNPCQVIETDGKLSGPEDMPDFWEGENFEVGCFGMSVRPVGAALLARPRHAQVTRARCGLQAPSCCGHRRRPLHPAP